jgi:hypothetical protein
MNNFWGYEVGILSGYDVKATDDTMFAMFLSNPMRQNFEDAIFEKLAK